MPSTLRLCRCKRKDKYGREKTFKTIAAIDVEVSEQPMFFTGETVLETFERRIADIPLDLAAVEKTIKRLTKDQKKLREKLKESAITQNKWATRLSKYIFTYAQELGISEYIEKNDCFLFKDLKSISGAIYHKMVFVFRISYARILSENLKYKTPLFIDSPHGREIEKQAVDQMIEVLERDFAEHQIFVASIFDIQKTRKDNKVIEMNGKLFDIKSGQMTLFDDE